MVTKVLLNSTTSKISTQHNMAPLKTQISNTHLQTKHEPQEFKTNIISDTKHIPNVASCFEDKEEQQIKGNNLKCKVAASVLPSQVRRTYAKHTITIYDEETIGSQLSGLKNINIIESAFLTRPKQKALEFYVNSKIQQRKIFSMTCSRHGSFETIKNGMLKRGWLQSFDCRNKQYVTDVPLNDPERKFVDGLLRDANPNLLWIRNIRDWTKIKPDTIVNIFPRPTDLSAFTTKIGLNEHLQQSYWYYEEGVSGVNFPTTHSIKVQEDLSYFVEDYVLTACTSLLKYVITSLARSKYDLFLNGDISIHFIDYAINRCLEYIHFREHRDIDNKEKCYNSNDKGIESFLSNFYKLTHKRGRFVTTDPLSVNEIVLRAQSTLTEIQRFRPQIKLDGYKNLWVVKKSNINRGKGITFATTLQDILSKIGEVKRPRYVIQKYIEEPLLIHETKFDIRQWILLTSVNPLEIWMYDECYLRFSSQLFTLEDTNESIHLCNNVIQQKYTNGKRNPQLPQTNMWDSSEFKSYLRKINQHDKWENTIYPGMKECITATLMAAQESMIARKNSFELYGVDFMLSEDFSPWLIEINSSPAMGPTTHVTSRMCNECFKDIIKVVIDRRRNMDANTGHFKLIYKQPLSNMYDLKADFKITGKKILL